MSWLFSRSWRSSGSAARSKVAVAASTSPASACACASQNVHSKVDGRLHPRVIPGQEPRDGQHQVRCVEVLAAEDLGEGLRLLVPAVFLDGRPDLLADGRPVRHPVLRAEVGGQGDRPVQGHPAHQLRVEEVPWLAADLPDALVLFPPAGSGGVGCRGQELPGHRVELAEQGTYGEVSQPFLGAEECRGWSCSATRPASRCQGAGTTTARRTQPCAARWSTVSRGSAASPACVPVRTPYQWRVVACEWLVMMSVSSGGSYTDWTAIRPGPCTRTKILR
jgi:hypothetical protein